MLVANDDKDAPINISVKRYGRIMRYFQLITYYVDKTNVILLVNFIVEARHNVQVIIYSNIQVVYINQHYSTALSNAIFTFLYYFIITSLLSWDLFVSFNNVT